MYISLILLTTILLKRSKKPLLYRHLAIPPRDPTGLPQMATSYPTYFTQEITPMTATPSLTNWIRQLASLTDDTELEKHLRSVWKLPGLEGWLLGQLFQMQLISKPTMTHLVRWIHSHHDSENPHQSILRLANIYLGVYISLKS